MRVGRPYIHKYLRIFLVAALLAPPQSRAQSSKDEALIKATEAAGAAGFTLPFGSALNQQDIDEIINRFADAQKNDLALSGYVCPVGTGAKICKIFQATPTEAAFSTKSEPSACEAPEGFEPFRDDSPVASSPAPSTGVDLSHTIEKLDQTRAEELVQSAVDTRVEIRRLANQDTETVSKPYVAVSIGQLGSALERAAADLSEAAQTLATGSSSLDVSENKRFTHLLTNASELAKAARSEITPAEIKANPKVIFPFQGQIAETHWNPLARSEKLAEIFSPTKDFKDPTSNEALVDRMIKLYGLPPEERAKVAERLRLADRVGIRLKNGQTKVVLIPNSGYKLGASEPDQLDCSSFMSQTLSKQLGVGRLTTLDMRQMWLFRMTGEFPKPPKYGSDRRLELMRIANNFYPVNIYDGDRLLPGDLIFARISTGSTGHVVMVKDFNANNLTARIVEASQTSGTVTERTLPLTYRRGNTEYLRPGFMGLRLKTKNPGICSLVKR